MCWAYGLVQEKGRHGGVLQLCEVYFEKKKPLGTAEVDWKQFREDAKIILKDLNSQAKAGFEFYGEGNKLILKKRRIGKRKTKR